MRKQFLLRNVARLVAFVTGISGSGRLALLQEVQRRSPSVHVIDVGSRMYSKSEELGVQIPEGKILDMDPLALDYLRAVTFEDILRELESTSHEVVAISTHVSFRWKKHLLQAFNFYYVNRIDPDIYVNVVDNAHSIYARLSGDRAWRNRLTIKDILVWRDEEFFITKMLADYRRKPCYLFPRREDPAMLERILFNVEKASKEGGRRMWKAYLSYPITHVKGDEKFFAEKEDIKKKLKEAGLVIFDPITIEDSVLIDLAIQAKSEGKEYVEISEDGFQAKVSVNDLLAAVEDIRDQIVARDYQLINQSDMLVVFYPVRVLSPGVLSEIKYGYTHNKDVFAIFPHEGASPFFEYYTTKVFKDVDSLIDHLKETGRL
ncbi:MAG: AAA family ATPase [Thermofilum sp.]|uniref:AAA family ATPase n=1 Tax=Thermofilum pendens TaxID=2269 RepID=A0A7C4H6N4_THEPE